MVEDQVSVELAPDETGFGLALIVTVGAGGLLVTVTVAEESVVPPLPVQLNVNVDVELNVPVDCEPEVALAPDQAPVAVQLVALVDDHVSVELAPVATVLGLALIVTVGAGGVLLTVTVVLAESLPPAPVQTRV